MVSSTEITQSLSLHTGRHEVDTIPAHVEHIHTDPFDEDAFRDSIQGRNFDVVFAMYGRLRSIVKVLVGRTPQLFTIGGMPVYEGYTKPYTQFPVGMPIPAPESAPLNRPFQSVPAHRQLGCGAVGSVRISAHGFLHSTPFYQGCQTPFHNET